MSVRFAGAPLLVIASVACGGAPASAPGAPSAPTSVAATTAPSSSPGAGERVLVERDDATADEPSYLKVELLRDGAFTLERIASNGGASRTVTTCTGRVPASEATEWHARLRDQATLTAPPKRPSYAEAIEQHLEHRYEIAYAAGARTTYAAPDPLRRDVDALIGHLDGAGTCKTSQRGR